MLQRVQGSSRAATTSSQSHVPVHEEGPGTPLGERTQSSTLLLETHRPKRGRKQPVLLPPTRLCSRPGRRGRGKPSCYLGKPSLAYAKGPALSRAGQVRGVHGPRTALPVSPAPSQPVTPLCAPVPHSERAGLLHRTGYTC